MAIYATKSEVAEAIIYNDEKMLDLIDKKYIPKTEGMSLISDTVLTAITNHLNNIGEGGGDSTDTDTTVIQTELDNYFAGKTAALGTDATGNT